MTEPINPHGHVSNGFAHYCECGKPWPCQAEVTLHADRELPPDLARALADVARVLADAYPERRRSYAVFVCTQGIIGCTAVEPHEEHELAAQPFVFGDAGPLTRAALAGNGLAEGPEVRHDRWRLVDDQPTCECGRPWRHGKDAAAKP